MDTLYYILFVVIAIIVIFFIEFKFKKSKDIISKNSSELICNEDLDDSNNSSNDDLSAPQYSQYTEINPDPISFNNSGCEKYNNSDYEGALIDFSKAIELNPNEPRFWVNRGWAYFYIKEYNSAYLDWIQALKYGSGNAQELINKYFDFKEVNEPRRDRKIIIETENYEIDNILKKYNIKYLYHMTHKDNINNILSCGLLSHNKAHIGIIKRDISDGQVNDRRKKIEPIYNRTLHDYAPLYFNIKNPMLYKRKDIQNEILILACNRKLITNENSLFTDGNAASNSTKFYNKIEYINSLDWKCINSEYWTVFVDGKRIRCAEVLVYNKIGIEDIEFIYTNNDYLCSYGGF